VANPERYGITLPPVSNTPYFTAVRKNKDIDVALAAELAEISVDEFKALNAAHNRPTIPADRGTLLLPANKVDIFNANLAAYQGKLSNWKAYQSKRGESYLSIAQRHGITLSQLRSINGLGSKSTKAVAQTLLVPSTTLGEGSLQLASLTNTPAAPVAQSTRRARTQTASVNRKNDTVVLRRGANVRTHTVRQGDTLYALAKRYDTSVAELRRLNNIKGSSLFQGDTFACSRFQYSWLSPPTNYIKDFQHGFPARKTHPGHRRPLESLYCLRDCASMSPTRC